MCVAFNHSCAASAPPGVVTVTPVFSCNSEFASMYMFCKWHRVKYLMLVDIWAVSFPATASSSESQPHNTINSLKSSFICKRSLVKVLYTRSKGGALFSAINESHINQSIGKLTAEIKTDEHLNGFITSPARTFNLHESYWSSFIRTYGTIHEQSGALLL